MTTRIYTVTDEETNAVALVRAGTRTQAIAHVVSRRFRAAVADQDALVKHIGDGVPVEDVRAVTELDG